MKNISKIGIIIGIALAIVFGIGLNHYSNFMEKSVQPISGANNSAKQNKQYVQNLTETLGTSAH